MYLRFTVKRVRKFLHRPTGDFHTGFNELREWICIASLCLVGMTNVEPLGNWIDVYKHTQDQAEI